MENKKRSKCSRSKSRGLSGSMGSFTSQIRFEKWKSSDRKVTIYVESQNFHCERV